MSLGNRSGELTVGAVRWVDCYEESSEFVHGDGFATCFGGVGDEEDCFVWYVVLSLRFLFPLQSFHSSLLHSSPCYRQWSE